MFGLILVVGQILCNVPTVLFPVMSINGLLTWIDRGFGIHQLALQFTLHYTFHPAGIRLFIGVRPLCSIYVSCLIIETAAR